MTYITEVKLLTIVFIDEFIFSVDNKIIAERQQNTH